MRNRALIARWVLEQATKDARANGAKPAVELTKKKGETYVRVNDYAALRTYFGQLLAEVQRIKSEGDFEAARQLVETYAINIDAKLHQEILDRYAKLSASPYKGFINPVYKAVRNAQGEITDVTLDYTEGYAEQMLRYSKEYRTLPLINE
jgi:dipeptidyl-peptidase-3